MRPRVKLLYTVLMLGSAAHGQVAGSRPPKADSLEQGFRDPPNAARPRVWWHWMNGNITEQGIKLDLEWMKRIGIGGFQNFDASFGTPQVVDKRLTYMTPEWKKAFRYAMTLADELGLEAAIAGSPGWSESGGPWVEPRQAMKKLVWSETTIEGGRAFAGRLARPPITTGPFQDLPEPRQSFRADPSTPEYYGDSAVVAYRIPDADVTQASLRPRITTSAGRLDVALLADGDLQRTTGLPKAAVGAGSWVRFDYGAPRTMRALTIAVRRPYNPQAQYQAVRETGQRIEASDDGVRFREIAVVPGSRVDHRTMAFPATTARYFRVVFQTLPRGPELLADYDGTPIPQPDAFPIAELVLHSGARVHQLEEKADFASAVADLSRSATPADADAVAIARGDVVDLTQRMRPDGSLDWTPPAGRWRVLRMGYSLTGHKNSPASPEATGLEVDKLGRDDVRSYFTTYLDQYKDAAGALMGKRGLQYVITDSWEAGFQNWTADMIGEFTRRRGYSPVPFLPVLTGQVVDSAQASDAFLWDFRRTVADLVAANHYDQLTDLLRARGMGRYTESHEGGRPMPADGMDVKRTAAVPMGAIWTDNPGSIGRNEDSPDIRESASVAHIYGQNIVAAESFTAFNNPWGWSPEMLKPTADKALALGLNRFVIHTSVHQPVVGKAPGLALGTFGQWFTRNETWAEQAKPWIDYLARASFVMQQGRAAADVLYFYGEDTNVTALFADRSPEVPAGYNYDFVNADALLNRVGVRDGAMVTDSGMRYRVIALGTAARTMSLPVLRKLAQLVAGGAVLVGERPVATPSLGDDRGAFDRIAATLWGPAAGSRTAGSGRVIDGGTIAQGLQTAGLGPDFDVAPAEAPTLLSGHRILADGDAYFVSNRSNAPRSFDATFRVAGRAADLWHPDDGRIEPTSYRIDGGRTTVPMMLAPYESVFVMFRRSTRLAETRVPVRSVASTLTVQGPWQVDFAPGRGAPAAATFPALTSWSDHATPGVRYFSGQASYSRTITLDPQWLGNGQRVQLDLGSVKNIASVIVNGREVVTLWKSPFRADVTRFLRPGANSLDIRVTNLWVNRLIGDQQPGTKKITFTTDTPYPANAPLLPSGLLGPVRLLREPTGN